MTIIEDATCTACGCLCDDIVLRAEGGRIVEARHACERGRAWFLADHGRGDRPIATIEGRAAGPAEAIARAAAILGGARAPIVLGLSRTTTEAQAAAVALADRIGAAIDPSEVDPAQLLAVQRVGRVGATLGEVKDRADLVIFWGVDPIKTHPRHLERYSAEPHGRFVPGGRVDRFLIVVDAEATASAAVADQFIPLDAEAQLVTLRVLRGLVDGRPIDPARASEATGLEWSILRGLADRLAGATYGAFFFGEGLGRSRGGKAAVEAALTFVRDLNDRARFVALPMGGPGNAKGAEAVLTWQAGYPFAVDLSSGAPRFLPGSATASIRLARGEADVALIVGDLPFDHLPENLPVVRIAPGAIDPARRSAVALNSATPGIDAPGTVVRVDGLMLPLRPALEPTAPTDHEWLHNIHLCLL